MSFTFNYTYLITLQHYKPGGGYFTMGETGMCASLLGSFWPENSGIGVSFY